MNNKDKILQCALELFYKKGYEAVGVQEIVDAAGITKPTLYHYFKSKYGLLEAVIEEGCTPFCEQLAQITKEYAKDIVMQLTKVAEAYIDFSVKNKKLFSFMLSLQYSPDESDSHKAALPYTVRIFSSVRDIFEQSADKLGNMNGRQEQFAISFLGIIDHYLLLINEKNDGENGMEVSEHEVYMLIHQFMHGIYS